MRRRFLHAHGRMHPWCGGRFLVLDRNADENKSWSTVFLVGLPAGLWLGFEWNVLWSLSPAVPLTGIALVAIAFIALLCAMLTEPGILSHERLEHRSFDSRGRVQLLVRLPDGSKLDLFDCQPPHELRVCYCKEIRCCVERFDHFCPWVGNAIGKRNYSQFVLFVSATTALAALVGASCVAHLVSEMEHSGLKEFLRVAFAAGGDRLARNVVAGVLILYSFFMLLLLGGLTTFHLLYLPCYGETTWEHLKDTYERGPNPHNKGCAANCAALLCGCLGCCGRVPQSSVSVSVGEDGTGRSPGQESLVRNDSLGSLEEHARGGALVPAVTPAATAPFASYAVGGGGDADGEDVVVGSGAGASSDVHSFGGGIIPGALPASARDTPSPVFTPSGDRLDGDVRPTEEV